MLPRTSLLLALLTATSVVACTAASSGDDDDGTSNRKSKSKTSPSKSDDDGDTEVEKEDDAPHAIGTIVLGESHASGRSNPTPIVSATFAPGVVVDAAKACTQSIDGCEFRPVPRCTKTPSGCAANELCTFDDACAAVCKPIVRCDETCEADEVCNDDGTGEGTCVKVPTFDAGPLAFSGTTTPITLFPPYAYESTGNGAPFLGGAKIQVQAQGATGAGFEGFDESMTATTFIQTSPALNKLPRAEVFGTGALPITWTAGKDAIVVTASGAEGSATCKADDASGRFELSRKVLTAVQGAAPRSQTPFVALSVARERTTTTKDKKAKGPYGETKVPSKGWLTLTSTSIESTSFQGCQTGQSICGDECADLATDRDHCGACSTACSTNQYCQAGACRQ